MLTRGALPKGGLSSAWMSTFDAERGLYLISVFFSFSFSGFGDFDFGAFAGVFNSFFFSYFSTDFIFGLTTVLSFDFDNDFCDFSDFGFDSDFESFGGCLATFAVFGLFTCLFSLPTPIAFYELLVGLLRVFCFSIFTILLYFAPSFDLTSILVCMNGDLPIFISLSVIVCF